MIFQKLSKRQLLTLTWWNRPTLLNHDAIICDGAIRSGKTIAMAVGFVLWSMTRFDGQEFGICGKTIESLKRNVTSHLPQWLEGIFTVHAVDNKVFISGGGHTNIYYLFGGRDESSYTLVQGVTLAGVLLDEVALMPRSFVEQATARCSIGGSKYWFNCNPAGTEHWFYKEWLCKLKKRNALHLHYTMADNLSLEPSIRERYERDYTGIFYRRYILGEWCVADGLVYANFDKDAHTTTDLPTDGLWYISCDYGTLNPFSAGLWCVKSGRAVRVAEYYYNGREKGSMKTDEEYYTELVALAGGRTIQDIVVDPSAASFIETIRRHGRYRVCKANNSVLDGIRATSTMLGTGRLKIGVNCADIIREFASYVWNEKADTDIVIKQNDHAMDDMRYFVMTILHGVFGWC